jgi:hypothetical protein
MVAFIPRFIASLLPVFMFLCADPAFAHSGHVGGVTSGISIPSLGHGEMAVIAPHQRAIMALALSAADTNEPFRRVLNYAQIQYAYCLWGVMPGTISDEASPFNECAHAYLAATKAVLLDMRTMPREAERADTLASEIDAELVNSGLAMVLCQFSAESFNTADLVRPRWIDVPSHLPSAFAALAFLAGISAVGWSSAQFLRTKPKSKRS